MRSSNAMRILVLCGLALGSLGSLCNPVSIFVCASDDDCTTHGPGGRCESNLACSFEDERCPEGRRWHSRADHEAGECLGSGLAGTDDDSGDDSDRGSSSALPQESGSDESLEGGGSVGPQESTTGSSSTGSSSTGSTSWGETSASSTSTGPGTTTSSESGTAPTCDEQYGSVLEYQGCAETPDTCSFNVRVDMSASCNQVCAMFETVCVIADLNDTGAPCVSIGEVPCDDMSFVDAICTCSRE